MVNFSPFETTLMGMLIDTIRLTAEQASQVRRAKEATGESVAAAVTRLGFVTSARLAGLIAQYHELPLVAPTFNPSVALDLLWEPIDFVLERNLVPVSLDKESLAVVGDCVPSRETVRELEELFGLDVRLRICDSDALAAALRKLRAHLTDIRALGPADCGYDKARFLRFCRAGWRATVVERFAGGLVRYHYTPAAGPSASPGLGQPGLPNEAPAGQDKPSLPVLTKTVESLHESEPAEMVELLVGKSMSCTVTPEMDLRELTAGFLASVRSFQGELKEAIFELRLAQLILDDSPGRTRPA